MIVINIEDNFLPERRYIIDILFNEFLGLNYQIRVSNTRDYEILIENGKKIKIRDQFFSKVRNELDYLNDINIPDKVKFLKNRFVVEKEIPVIYGNEELEVIEDEIICGIDIFGSCLFMLTRWEEYVCTTRDEHNRFPAIASLAYRNNFINRPVVNEYVEMLWNMLVCLGYKKERKKREFRLLVSHDVDRLFHMGKSFGYRLSRGLGKRFIQEKVNLAKEELMNWLLGKMDKSVDEFDTFDWIMDQSEKMGIKSVFNFKATSKAAKFDASYDLDHPMVKSIIQRILRRGHEIGFHPGYYTPDDKEKWFKEWENFRYHFRDVSIKGGRQHYLRFQVPITWRFWDDAGLEYDSTLSFADYAGFRCGVCYEYPVFDIIERKRLKIRERPLLVMEKTLLKQNYMNLSGEKMEDYVKNLRETVKRYHGDFSLLWHNKNLIEKYSRNFYLKCIDEDRILF